MIGRIGCKFQNKNRGGWERVRFEQFRNYKDTSPYLGKYHQVRIKSMRPGRNRYLQLWGWGPGHGRRMRFHYGHRRDTVWQTWYIQPA